MLRKPINNRTKEYLNVNEISRQLLAMINHYRAHNTQSYCQSNQGCFIHFIAARPRAGFSHARFKETETWDSIIYCNYRFKGFKYFEFMRPVAEFWVMRMQKFILLFAILWRKSLWNMTILLVFDMHYWNHQNTNNSDFDTDTM